MKNVTYAHHPRPIGLATALEPIASSALVADMAGDSDCNSRLFKAGETVFAEGSSADKAYIIESGYVEIFVGAGEDSLQLSVLGPGDIFGEMGIIDASPRSASILIGLVRSAFSAAA